MIPTPATTGGIAYRIRAGDWVAVKLTNLSVQSVQVNGRFRVQYDDGTWDLLTFPTTPVDSTISPVTDVTDNKATQDGWVIGMALNTDRTPTPGSLYAQAFVNQSDGTDPTNTMQELAAGYLGSGKVTLGQFDPFDFRATWAFQGQVVSDATGGTHVCTLTITPGLGNELEVVGGSINLAGAAALAAKVIIDDGTNELIRLQTQGTAGLFSFPVAFTGGSGTGIQANPPTYCSGSMRLVLSATTSTVSQTQVFSVVCRIRGTSRPTAVLADNVGAPTLTTNTSAVF